MKRVTVYKCNNSVAVNEKFLNFEFTTPDVFPENFYYLLWWDEKHSYFTIEDGDVNNQTEHVLEPTEENYNKFVKQFVEQWEAEKERLAPTPEELKAQEEARIQKQLTDAVQHVLDSKAQELLYDNCLSVCSYIDTGVQKFDAEGKAFRAWRSQVWAKGYEILAQVQSGEREIPSEENLIAELPELVIEYSGETR